MTSKRATVSILKSVSPQRLPSLNDVKGAFNFKLNRNRNFLSVENLFIDSKSSPNYLNIDTPNKKKILDKGILDKCKSVLGNGAYGTVYRASYKGNLVAAKIIKKNDFNKILIETEKQAAKLRHENIVKILKVDEGSALTLITMELCGKSLHDLILENLLTKNEKLYIWTDIAKALIYCHKKNIIHADVKPKNVLIGSNGKPKLADFGSAIFLSERYLPQNFHGTPGYAAPEVVQGKAPTSYSDIFSLGVTAWQMVSKKNPFENVHKHTILYLTGKGMTPCDKDLDDGFEGKYKDLYRMSWNITPEKRPTLCFIIMKLKELKN